MLKKTSFLLLFLFCLPVFANSWSFLGADNYYHHYVDVGSIRAKQGKYRFWIKTDLNQDINKRYMTDMTFNCTTNNYVINQELTYSNHKLIQTRKFFHSSKPNYLQHMPEKEDLQQRFCTF